MQSDDEHHFPFDQVTDERVRQAVQILTTEHFTLQSARGIVISEINGRLTVFLGALSSALIAIGFVAQASKMDQSFHVFTLIVLSAVLLLGLMTIGRLGLSNRQDTLYSVGINRVRHFYVELIPELRPYFVQPTNDDLAGSLQGLGMRMSPWLQLVAAPTVVASLNAFIAGVLVGLILSWVIGWPEIVAATGGLIAGALTMALQAWIGQRSIHAAPRSIAPLFPTPKA